MIKTDSYQIAFLIHSAFGGQVECILYRERKVIHIFDDKLGNERAFSYALADFRIMT